MSSLNTSLEKLDRALDALEKAFEYKMDEIDEKYKNLKNQLHQSQSQSSVIAQELDQAIDKIETVLQSER